MWYSYVAASFQPLSSPAELLSWLDDPVLISSPAPSDDEETETFEIEVPEDVRHQAEAKFPTTLVLPSGVRISVKRGEGVEIGGETVFVNIRMAALQALGQFHVRTYHGEHDVDLPGPSALRNAGEHAGELRPLDPAELELECPLINPEDISTSLRGGDTICVVCAQPLDCGGEKMLPLRQLCAPARPEPATAAMPRTPPHCAPSPHDLTLQLWLPSRAVHVHTPSMLSASTRGYAR